MVNFKWRNQLSKTVKCFRYFPVIHCGKFAESYSAKNKGQSNPVKYILLFSFSQVVRKQALGEKVTWMISYVKNINICIKKV